MAVNDRRAILKLMGAILLVIIGSLILFFGVLAALEFAVQIKSHFVSASTAVTLALLVVGAIIDLLGAASLFGGFRMMHGHRIAYDMGEYGALVQLAAAIILTVGFYFIIFSSSSSFHTIGSGFTLLGYAIGSACSIPVGIAFYKMGEKYGAATVKAGAVGYVLVPILGPAVLYLGMRGIAHRKA